MLSDPTGNFLQMADVLRLLPVSDYVLPGIFLLVVMGIFPLLLTYALLARPNWPRIDSLFQWSTYYWAWTATLGLVVILAIRLAIEGLLIRMYPITYFTVAIGLLALVFAMLPGVRKYCCEKR